MKKPKGRMPPAEILAEARDPEALPAHLEALYYRFPAILGVEVAQHPNAPPTLLEKLSQIKALQALVAKNPNTPLTTLHQLWEKHTASLLLNPALPLWLLESPSFWRELPAAVQVAVAAEPGLDASQLLSLWESTRSTQVRSALLKHPLAPYPLIEAASTDYYLAAAVATRRDLSEAIWLRLFGSQNINVREAIEQNPTRPEGLLLQAQQLGWTSNAKSSAILRETTLDSEALIYLAGGGPYLQLLVVVQLKAPPEALTRIAASKDKDLRQQVARHPNTPDETLLALLRESAEGCMLQIARRPGLSLALGSAILRYKDSSVSFQMALHELASKPDTEPPLLLRLLREHGNHCAPQLMARATLPRSLVRAALESRRHLLQRALVARRDLLPDDLESLSRASLVEVRLLVARHENTSEATRARLALDEHAEVRAAVVGAPEASEVRRLLARCASPNPLVRRELLQESLPQEVWRALLNDADESVVEATLAHPGLPAALRSCIKMAQAQRPLSPKEQEVLSSLGGLGARLKAEYYLEPRWLLDELFASLSREVLRGMASHPVAPKALYQRFIECYSDEPLARVTPWSLLPGRDEALRVLLAPALLAHQVEPLLAHRDPLVRRSLAKHPSAPLVFVCAVIFGRDLGEQLALLKNPALPALARRWALLHPRLAPRLALT